MGLINCCAMLNEFVVFKLNNSKGSGVMVGLLRPQNTEVNLQRRGTIHSQWWLFTVIAQSHSFETGI